MRSVEQLDDNLGAAGWHLTPEQTSCLDEVSDPGRPDYPYGFIADITAERRAAVGRPRD